MVPCPTHTHGHPTIVLTHLFPIAHNRHQNQPQDPGEAPQFDSIEQIRGSPSSSDATLSPASPSRKRRNSNPSPAKNPKRTIASQPSSRESSTSPEDLLKMRLDDGNPFEVRSYFNNNMYDRSGSTSSRPQERLQRANIIYRSQQDQPYSRRNQPSTPPTLRHRVRSLGPESPGDSPAQIDVRDWSFHANSDTLRRVEEEMAQGDCTPTRRFNPEGSSIRLVRTDGGLFTAIAQESDSQATQTPQNTLRHFDLEILPSSIGRADVEMDQGRGSLLDDAKTPTRVNGRRLSISSSSTLSLHNDSPISVHTVSRRHSIAGIESPTFKTPTRSRRKSSFGRVLRDDGSLSSGRINSLPDSSPMGIDWSQSLETPAKRRQSQGAAKTPITNVIQRLRGLPTTPKGEEQSQVGEFTDWNPSLETPPRKVSLTEKYDISESRISAKVLDELRGVPSSSRAPAPHLPVEKQNVMSSQEEDGSFYSAASSILSDDDDDYQNASGNRAAAIRDNADQRQAQSSGVSTNTNDNYPAESKMSPVLSSFDHAFPAAGLAPTSGDGTGTLLAPTSQEFVEGSPIVDSPLESQVFSESQEDMFEGVTSAEINHALMARSTQGSHHLTQPEESHGDQAGTLLTTSADPFAFPRRTSHSINTNPTSFVGFRSASGRSTFQVSAERLSAARRLFESDSKEVTGENGRAGNGAAVQALASNMLNVAGACGQAGIDAEENLQEARLRGRRGHMENGEAQNDEGRQESPEVESEDDFGNIRFSQLDDGFNVVPEATQKPRKRPTVSITNMRTPRLADDLDWVAMSSDMLGNLFETDDHAAQSHQEVRPHVAPPVLGGGFSSAGGKRLDAISSAALARASGMFADDENGMGLKDLAPEGVVPEQRSAHIEGSGGFGGFSSAGKTPLPQISAPTKERAMRMMQDSDMDIDDGNFQEHTRPAATPFGGVPPAAEQPGFTPPHIGSGGFSSGSGRKLAPVSKAVADRWSKEFSEIDGDAAGRRVSSVSTTKPTTKTLGGFPSGGGKKLAPISKAAMDKWSKELAKDMNNDADSLESSVPTAMPSSGTMGGFSSGGGKKLAPVSKSAMDKWSKELTKGEDVTGSPIASEPGQPQTPTAQPLEVGFASGAGKVLAPISKAAQARAYSFLELEQPTALKVTSSVNTSTAHSGHSLPASASPSGSVSSSSSSSPRPQHVPSQPPISTHMQNLKMKTLRGSSKGPLSLPGHLKPVLKSGVTPFKSPVQFRSPLRTPLQPSISNSANATVSVHKDNPGSRGSGTPHDSSASAPGAQSSEPKKTISKRLSLHPTARAAPTTPIPSFVQPLMAVQPLPTRFDSLVFNLQAHGVRTKLRDTLGTPKRLTTQELVDRGLPEGALLMTFEQARHYRFDGWGVDEAYEELLSLGAKADLLSRVWLLNHYRQVVWKLACYVRTWPEYFIPSTPEPSSWFCPAKVLNQLAYRYEREVNRAERPALRKIVEGDESAAKHIVLVIAGVSKAEQPSDKEDSTAQKNPWKVLVSDGWYTIPAVLDPCLIRAVEGGRLKVGSKVHVCRAKLSGAESGVDILELAGAGSESTSVSIVLQANSTRLARWDTKLGFQSAPLIWTKQLRSIVPDGGLVPGLDVIVLRKYPVLYLETLEDGVTKIKRTVKEESSAVEAHRDKIQQRYQDMIREVEKEFASEMDPEGRPSLRVQEEIMTRAQDMQTESAARNVIPLFSIRVGNYRHGGNCGDDDMDENGRIQEALITFWHDDHSHYQEGNRVRMTALMSKKLSREYGFEDMIQLAGTRMTTVQEMPTEPETMLLTSYRPRTVAPCAEIGSLTPGTEVDLVLVILAVDESTIHSSKAYFIATDATRRLLLVEHQLSSLLTGDGNRPLPSFLKVQNRILMANGRFRMRDHKLDLDIVSSTLSYTQVTTAPSFSSGGGVSGGAGWPSYALASLQRLNAMVNETEKDLQKDDGERGETFSELMNRADAILRELHPSL
ncbi:Breast cancer 2, early onset [Mortierella hygrophila]|uniref:Breast cancer 2, early onset n=1 Tax=Mortierella hygrophila TaxID=979708 RepID=A0A9P6JY73_9FUNG|nr:Breast cancer 2, early onset [Mortierella hygrophila]